jgi:TolB protein
MRTPIPPGRLALLLRRVPALALLPLLAACADTRECSAGSPLMPVCEPLAMEIPGEPHLVFQSNHEGTFQIYTMNSDGSGLRRLTEGPAVNVRPVWSPDGSRIAFTSNRQHIMDVFTMRADGSDQRNLTNHPEIDAFPHWSPDGRQIAFHSLRTGGKPDIFVMNADGTEVRQLTSHTAWNIQPRWSPDGTRIAFISDRAGWPHVYLMNADGSEQRRLTDEGMQMLPAWSPEGRHLAFQAVRAMDMQGATSIQQIYVMRIGGMGAMNVSMSSSNDYRPTWSRSGEIYFVSDRSGAHELWVMNRDGSGQRQVTQLGRNVDSPHVR